MNKKTTLLIAVSVIGLYCLSAIAAVAAERDTISPPRKLTAEQSRTSAENYQKYCAICHGENREGHKNDHAPSLRSKSLMESGVPHAILRALSYGREGTAMGGYLDEIGGPMTLDETWDLTYWLWEQAGYDRLRFSTNPIEGDVNLGSKLYANNCTNCHGKNGEGINAPALFNASALSHNSDEFIEHAIIHGRQDSPMPAFAGVLTSDEIRAITAFIRSKARNDSANQRIVKALPTPEQYIINKNGDDPKFNLKDGLYVSSEELNNALVSKKRMVLLDTRVTSVWQTAHIEGAIPFPYYADLDETVEGIPKDVQIVAYCSCPRAVAAHTIKKLRRRGYFRTAVLWEGIFGWQNLGYPVTRGEVIDIDD